jgi:hypothetical protein
MLRCPARCAGWRRGRCTGIASGRWQMCRWTPGRLWPVFGYGAWPVRSWAAGVRLSASKSLGSSSVFSAAPRVWPARSPRWSRSYAAGQPLSPRLLPGHALALRHCPAPAAAGPSADGRPARGDRDRRLRPAPPPPLRHDHHRRRDRAARRCPARPRSRHRGGMAAWEEKGRGRVPGRLSHLRRGHPTGITACRAGQRPLAPVAEPVRQGPGRGPRPRPLLGNRQPAPSRRRPRADHPRAPAQSPHLPRPGRRPARMRPPARARPEHGKTLRPQPRTVRRSHRPPATGPPRSTPTATTCAGAGPTTRSSPSPTSCTRSGNSDTSAVPACWSDTSTRAAPKATAS